ncbi:hypothetical protein ACXWRS_11350, partial [Streptococcus pyogenes]
IRPGFHQSHPALFRFSLSSFFSPPSFFLPPLSLLLPPFSSLFSLLFFPSPPPLSLPLLPFSPFSSPPSSPPSPSLPSLLPP